MIVKLPICYQIKKRLVSRIVNCKKNMLCFTKLLEFVCFMFMLRLWNFIILIVFQL